MFHEERKLFIDESKVSFLSPNNFIVSIFRSTDPENMTYDDYLHMKKLMKKLWNEEKTVHKLQDAHMSYWRLLKGKKELTNII